MAFIHKCRNTILQNKREKKKEKDTTLITEQIISPIQNYARISLSSMLVINLLKGSLFTLKMID